MKFPKPEDLKSEALDPTTAYSGTLESTNKINYVNLPKAAPPTYEDIQKTQIAMLEKMLADSQRQVWTLQCGLMALIDGTVLDTAGNRNDDGMRDHARSGSVPEKVVGRWLALAEVTLKEGSK